MNQALTAEYTAALESGDAARLESLLKSISAALEQTESQELHHLRGLTLAALQRPAEALAAQRRALELQETAAAHYSAGLLLADAGQDAEAMRHWARATQLEPSHADAWYNLGQVQYNHGQFTAALESWQRTHALLPSDFETLKKIVQAERALERWDEANLTMQTLFEVWQRSPDPAVRDLFEVTVDQFSVAGKRVMAAEMLRPRQPDLYYETVFRVLNENHQTIMTVQLESSQYGRDQGVPYLLGMNTQSGHQSVGPTFAVKPSYASLKPMAVRLIEAHLGQPAPSSLN